MACEEDPHLVLHFDVNQTIMVADVAAQLTTDEGLNKAICKCTLVRRRSELLPGSLDAEHAGSFPKEVAEALHQWQWCDSSGRAVSHSLVDLHKDDSGNIVVPPLHFDALVPEQCTPFSEVEIFRGLRKRFTELVVGRPFRELYDRIRAALQWTPHDPVEGLSDAEDMHVLVPSFFRTLAELHNRGRRFTCVIRTFGHDLPLLKRTMDSFARGLHVNVPSGGSSSAPATWCTFDDIYLLRRSDSADYQSEIRLLAEDGTVVASGEEELADFFERKSSSVVLGVQDEYEVWKAANYIPGAGKPVWFTRNNHRVHHIFFDDNIHYNPKDSIVCVRARENSGDRFLSLDGEQTLAYHGSMLVKVQVVEAILDEQYFLKKIADCEKRLGSIRSSLPTTVIRS